MSIQIMAMIFKHEFDEVSVNEKGRDARRRITADRQKLVMLALADCANDEGESIYPGIELLCQKTNLPSSALCATLSILLSSGYISNSGRSKYNTVVRSINLGKFLCDRDSHSGNLKNTRDSHCEKNEIPTVGKNPSVKPPDINLFSIAEALATVCHMDLEANKGQLLREARLLKKATPAPTVELLKAHYNGNPNGFWKTKDWRGKKGQFPKPANIRETWGQWETEKIDEPPADFGPDYHPPRPELDIVGGSLFKRPAKTEAAK